MLHFSAVNEYGREERAKRSIKIVIKLNDQLMEVPPVLFVMNPKFISE